MAEKPTTTMPRNCGKKSSSPRTQKNLRKRKLLMLNANSLPSERFVKARHARFSEGIMYIVVATLRLSTALAHGVHARLCIR